MSDPETDFSHLTDLASPRFGGRTLDCSDDFFASMENLLKPEAPVFLPDKYTDRGKWMDGWESRRKRQPGHDWCLIRLGVAGVVRGVVIDTAHFVGNYPESASLEGRLAEGDDSDAEWIELLPRSALRGDSKNVFSVDSPYAVAQLRLNIFPDGGVARLRAYGEVVPDWDALASEGGLVDLASAALGARVLHASDMHFGSRHNLIMPDRAIDMRDGWETRRRRGPGHDWCVVRLAAEGVVRKIEIDTAHFKGNFPDSCSLDVCLAGETLPRESVETAEWEVLLPQTKLQADHRHQFEPPPGAAPAVDHARLNIFPDGGVSRLRLWGEPTPHGWRQIGLRSFNASSQKAAEARLRPCCSSRRWAAEVARRRPFPDLACLQTESDDVWMGLTTEDYLEAFAGHPRIGESRAEGQPPARAAQWSGGEQSQAAEADPAVKAQLLEANRLYEQRHGFIFIVCATGKSASEILGLLRQRLENDRETEIRNAAEQQRKITQLRLEKLFLP